MNQIARIAKVGILLFFLFLSNNVFSQQLEFMGLPLHSSISEYSKALSLHRFKDEYPGTHTSWSGGDFWKQKNCFVWLFAGDDINVDIVRIGIPYTNFVSYDDYSNVTMELISDLSNKYGKPQLDTLNIEKEKDYYFAIGDHQNDECFIVKWTLPNGELRIMINNDRVYTILMQYKSIEYIKKQKEAARFKGQGASDL